MPKSEKRSRPLGVIFLTLLIDLIGFSIIFPLGPALIDHYLSVDGHSGLLGWLLSGSYAVARALGREAFAPVLFGGVLTSFFSVLQFIFAPFWGSLSDRLGRRVILRITVAGTAVGYFIWIFSGSFWIFLLSRMVSGAFSGNLSVATAAVADVTTRQERSRAMGIVGAAFGLGLVTGPMVGGISSLWNPLAQHPSLARYGINPFSIPAFVSFGLCLVNLAWITRSFHETLAPEAQAGAVEARLRNPIRAIFALRNSAVRRANAVNFAYSVAFVAMETSLTFLATKRFNYTTTQNSVLLCFMGVCSIVTQGYIVRRLLKSVDEIRVLKSGLVCTGAGLLIVGLALHPSMLYAGLVFLAFGSGLVNPSTSGLISLYSDAAEQGRVLGIFRSLGSLARAVTPILAGAVFWILGSRAVFVGAAALAVVALALSSALPKPVK